MIATSDLSLRGEKAPVVRRGGAEAAAADQESETIVPGCVLRIRTKTWDVDMAVKASGLRPIVIFRKGTPKAPGATTRAKCSGFNVDVSRKEDLGRQVRDAVRFLRRHAAGLKRLRRSATFGGMALDFGDWYRATGAARWPSYHFPVTLVELAGRHGIEIELSLYGTKPAGPRRTEC